MWDGADDDSQYHWSVRGSRELRGAVTTSGAPGGHNEALPCMKSFNGSLWFMGQSLEDFLEHHTRSSASIALLLYVSSLLYPPSFHIPCHFPTPPNWLISPNLLTDAMYLFWTAQTWKISIITCNSNG